MRSRFYLLLLFSIVLAGCGSVNYAPGRAYMVNEKGQPVSFQSLVGK